VLLEVYRSEMRLGLLRYSGLAREREENRFGMPRDLKRMVLLLEELNGADGKTAN
jgi:hypothetical protein